MNAHDDLFKLPRWEQRQEVIDNAHVLLGVCIVSVSMLIVVGGAAVSWLWLSGVCFGRFGR